MKLGIYTLGLERIIFKNSPELVHLKFEHGWGNGYVLLPKYHPFYGKDYDEINIIVHGGLTFGDYFDKNTFLKWIKDKDIFGDITVDNYEKFHDYWMIGFDTGHYGDTVDNCGIYYVKNEVGIMLEQCLDPYRIDLEKYKRDYIVSLRKEKLENINGE
jgi:hypothetical protein